jgi:exonuclease SbcD
MRKVSFLHCSDIHLDMPFKYLGDSEKSSVRRQELLEIFDEIVDMAGKKGVDFLLISGDLYEHDYTLRKTILHVREKFAQIHHVKVVLLPGNHDPYTSNSFYATIDWPENVHILNADTPVLHIEELETSIFGMGWESSVAEGLKRVKKETVSSEKINILLFHGSVDMLFSKQAFNPVDSTDLAGLGMDYIAIGHFHNSFGEFGPARNIFNPGSPETLAFDQPGGARGIFEVSIAKEGNKEAKINSCFLVTGKRKYRDIAINVDLFEEGKDLEKSVKERMQETGSPDDLFRIFLKGYRPRGTNIDVANLLERLSSDAFFVKVFDETTEEINYEALSKTPGIKGLFTLKMFDKINQAEEKEKKIFERALRYGLQALDEGKVDLEI